MEIGSVLEQESPAVRSIDRELGRVAATLADEVFPHSGQDEMYRSQQWNNEEAMILLGPVLERLIKDGLMDREALEALYPPKPFKTIEEIRQEEGLPVPA